MSRPSHTPPPDYAGIIVGRDDRGDRLIMEIALPAVPGVCACDVSIGSMVSSGRVICCDCGKVMAPRIAARASG